MSNRNIVFTCISTFWLYPTPVYSAWNTTETHTIEHDVFTAHDAETPNSEATLNAFQMLPKDAEPAKWINLAPLGLGSYAQGDLQGGLTLTTIDLASLLIISTAFTPLMRYAGGGSAALLPITAGGLIYIFGRDYALRRPEIFARAYNQALISTPASQIHTPFPVEPLQASLLNLIPFGVGSFQQGDFTTAVSLLLTDLLSVGLITYGVVGSDLSTPQANPALVWGIMGLTTGRSLGLISPWFHQQETVIFSEQMPQNLSAFNVINYQFAF